MSSQKCPLSHTVESGNFFTEEKYLHSIMTEVRHVDIQAHSKAYVNA